jgi:protein-tyrosine-phosphatase
MAEGMAREILGPDVQVASAGTHAHIRDPPAVNAVKILREKFGVDILSHRSRNVDDVHIETFDYVVPMADDIHEYLKENFPSLGKKLLPSWGINDPYGGDRSVYEETAVEIKRHVEQLAFFLKNTQR